MFSLNLMQNSNKFLNRAITRNLGQYTIYKTQGRERGEMHSMERKDIILWVILISLRNAYKLIEDLDLECKYYWYGATMYFKAIRKMCTTYDETTR